MRPLKLIKLHFYLSKSAVLGRHKINFSWFLLPLMLVGAASLLAIVKELAHERELAVAINSVQDFSLADLSNENAQAGAPRIAVNRYEIKLAVGDKLERIFDKLAVQKVSLLQIFALPECAALKVLQPEHKLIVALNTADRSLRSLQYEINQTTLLDLTVSKGNLHARIINLKPLEVLRYVAANVKGSIYLSAKEQGVPPRLISQFIKLFDNAVDFRRVVAKDRYSLIYREFLINGMPVKNSELVAAELIHHQQVHRVFAFKDSKGKTEFYTSEGRNVKPAFDRFPVTYTRIASHFAPNRIHPILGIKRPHLGVDLAAKTGTPVRAAAAGQIIFAGSKGGYGRTIMLKTGIYTTLYAHLSRYIVKTGQFVKQGELIGYVGATGLATSSHLHYEFRINGVPHDPLRVTLPAGEPIKREQREAFAQLVKRLGDYFTMYAQQQKNNAILPSQLELDID